MQLFLFKYRFIVSVARKKKEKYINKQLMNLHCTTSTNGVLLSITQLQQKKKGYKKLKIKKQRLMLKEYNKNKKKHLTGKIRREKAIPITARLSIFFYLFSIFQSKLFEVEIFLY